MTHSTLKAQNSRYSANFLRSLKTDDCDDILGSLSDLESAYLLYDWPFWARKSQLPPEGEWLHWLILAGRGFGKTRTGAEWVRRLVEKGQAKRIALVAPTAADARATMVEGESGLLAISPPWFRPKYEPSKRQLVWPNGAVATTYSADEPERLRGPQHDAAWLDELCAWRRADQAFDMLMFGLRLGQNPRTCITTTPKPTSIIKRLVGSDGVMLTHGTTYDNLENLAPTFRSTIVKRYEGTRLGRQELNAEILSDVPGALWQRATLEKGRVTSFPDLDRIVVAVDPPITSGVASDECGIVAAGRRLDRGFIVADRSARMSPLVWARTAVSLYHDLKADRIVAEVNQGGDMVTAIIRQVDPTVPIKTVVATRGKLARAEPVAALYEQGKISHADVFTALEDQMCSYTGVRDKSSPDRLDALVWALTDLMLTDELKPRLRTL